MADNFDDDETKAWRALLALRQIFDAEPITPDEVNAALERRLLNHLPNKLTSLFLVDEAHHVSASSQSLSDLRQLIILQNNVGISWAMTAHYLNNPDYRSFPARHLNGQI